MNDNFDLDLDEVEDVANEDILYDGDDGETDEAYSLAVRSVVFGGLAIILPVLAWVASLFGSALIPLLIAGGGLAFAISSLVCIKKCGKPTRGSYSEGLVKAGKIVGIIGLVLASVVIAYLLLVIIVSVIIIISAISFYMFAIYISILSAMFG